ncbi:MAG: hypothetical protein HN370_01795, partial [Phycisphaerales bacterium]|nr:hypothetical protein [Phycisphaerales bacterium]
PSNHIPHPEKRYFSRCPYVFDCEFEDDRSVPSGTKTIYGWRDINDASFHPCFTKPLNEIVTYAAASAIQTYYRFDSTGTHIKEIRPDSSASPGFSLPFRHDWMKASKEGNLILAGCFDCHQKASYTLLDTATGKTKPLLLPKGFIKIPSFKANDACIFSATPYVNFPTARKKRKTMHCSESPLRPVSKNWLICPPTICPT